MPRPSQERHMHDLKGILRDFKNEEEADAEVTFENIDGFHSEFNQPYMIYFALTIGLGSKPYWKLFEKTLWSIFFFYKDVPFRLDHWKLGVQVAAPSGTDRALIDEMIQALKRSFPVVDRLMEQKVKEQIDKGQLTVRNQSPPLYERYRFFREHALEAYSSPPPPPSKVKSPDGRYTETSQDIFKPHREGFFYGTAAIDAFFSWLEHFFVIAIPFFGFDPTKESLSELIGLSWSDKMKRILDLENDLTAKRLYDRLVTVKETLRNPFSHGGFDKQWGAILVHMEGVGGIPATLSNHKMNFFTFFYPLEEDEFRTACDLFDELETYFQNSALSPVYTYGMSRLPVFFSEEERLEYRRAMESDEDFQKLMERLCREAEYHSNMEW